MYQRNAPFTSERALLPVLARVLDLGQGPPGLVSWVQYQLTSWNLPGTGPSESVLHRLACELLHALPNNESEGRSDEGCNQTVCTSPLETVLVPTVVESLC
ncbi:hypothetical protein VT84_12940 [Gemmata sp. SH-PL17]|uniref:hypothetical protein n=1 Tax=Gemmata sp. SH-PL17 TaxID=1630693 RepID=UPI0004B7E563|nr:hypothetical protein [Gemmata sp. SH-PL17]AMV25299.1 hypothetical protein VT84_12940 [Gemmata sp. SH-PL17]